MSEDTPQPLISIVTSTFNRSNVLKWTIKSVIGQTHKNWELWVIGDACTDDTEAVVQSFADPRIHFYNLPRNIGYQSGPNNEGCRRSTGEYIAYLSHDDLWFPDHLEKSLSALRSESADFVYSLVVRTYKNGSRRAEGAYADRLYKPGRDYVPSCWLFKRSLFEEIGPWRYYKETYNIPSQDWLFRVWKAGKKMSGVPHLTVIVITVNPGDYARREDQEQQSYYHRIVEDPCLREELLTEMLYDQPQFLQRSIVHISGVTVARMLRASIYKIERRVLEKLKVDPNAHRRWRKLERKGKFVEDKQKWRGLEIRKSS